MSDNKHEIDFKELENTVRGEGLEGLTRMLGRSLSLNPVPSGRGADQDKDLFFTDILRGSLNNTSIKWLVSCKDFAASGKAVSKSDLPNHIELTLKQHGAIGFLLVTTTVASTGAKAFLDAIDVRNGGMYHTLVWDETELREMLLRPENESILKQFLPKSYRRVSSMGTLQGALEAYRSEIPIPLYNTLVGLISPFEDKSLFGFTIWPQDNSTAKIIDEIIHALVATKSVDTAVAAAESLASDALVAMLAALHKKRGSAVNFARQVISKANNSQVILTASQFISDYNSLEGTDVYLLLLKLGIGGSAGVVDQHINWYLESSIPYSHSYIAFASDLSNAFDNYFVNEVFICSFTIVEAKDLQDTIFRCSGDMQVDIHVDTSKAGDRSEITSIQYPGAFDLTINRAGFTLEVDNFDMSRAIEADVYRLEEDELYSSQ